MITGDYSNISGEKINFCMQWFYRSKWLSGNIQKLPLKESIAIAVQIIQHNMDQKAAKTWILLLVQFKERELSKVNRNLQRTRTYGEPMHCKKALQWNDALITKSWWNKISLPAENVVIICDSTLECISIRNDLLTSVAKICNF